MAAQFLGRPSDAAGFRKLSAVPLDALREYSHVIAVQEVWLSRIHGRASALAIWPALTVDDLAVVDRVIAAYDDFLAELSPSALAGKVHYANSAGKTFETAVSDILMHVVLHSQYHRGKVNAHLRAAGQEPIPTDFITFVRGVPAATTPDR